MSSKELRRAFFDVIEHHILAAYLDTHDGREPNSEEMFYYMGRFAEELVQKVVEKPAKKRKPRGKR